MENGNVEKSVKNHFDWANKKNSKKIVRILQ